MAACCLVCAVHGVGVHSARCLKAISSNSCIILLVSHSLRKQNDKKSRRTAQQVHFEFTPDQIVLFNPDSTALSTEVSSTLSLDTTSSDETEKENSSTADVANATNFRSSDDSSSLPSLTATLMSSNRQVEEEEKDNSRTHKPRKPISSTPHKVLPKRATRLSLKTTTLTPTIKSAREKRVKSDSPPRKTRSPSSKFSSTLKIRSGKPTFRLRRKNDYSHSHSSPSLYEPPTDSMALTSSLLEQMQASPRDPPKSHNNVAHSDAQDQ